jgi:hypothetical protein
MGYELYRHVLNHAPDEIDAAARLVLAVIADDANEKTRKSYLGMDLLSHRTGLLPDSVGKALRRLAKAGVEIRVPLGTDKRGRPVFAAKGNRTTYMVPVFRKREFAPSKVAPEADLQSQSPDERQTKEDSKPGPSSAKPGREADPPPQSPHKEETSADPSGPTDPTSPKEEREDVERVCAHLRQRVIDGGKPAHLVNITDKWRTAARLLMDRDGVTEDQVHRAIDWVQDHDFWRTNVRAMPKLREKYFELRDQAARDRNRQKPKPAPGSMASQRTATRCTEHALPLPCSSCRGDIRAGDDEVPRRLLAEHGPEVRWDLAERLNKGEAA